MSCISLNLFYSFSYYSTVLIFISLLFIYILYNFIDFLTICKQRLFKTTWFHSKLLYCNNVKINKQCWEHCWLKVNNSMWHDVMSQGNSGAMRSPFCCQASLYWSKPSLLSVKILILYLTWKNVLKFQNLFYVLLCHFCTPL